MCHRFLECELDESCRALQVGGQTVAVEPKVFDLLVYLIRHRDRVVLKGELLEHLWPEQVVSDAALSQCIKRARHAIGDTDPSQRVIRTFHRRGFRFFAPVESRDAPPAGRHGYVAGAVSGGRASLCPVRSLLVGKDYWTWGWPSGVRPPPVCTGLSWFQVNQVAARPL